MFRFLKECLATWIKCLIGEILAFMILGMLILVAYGIGLGIASAILYLSH